MHLLQFLFNRCHMLSTNIMHFIMYCNVLFFDGVSTLHYENKVRLTSPKEYGFFNASILIEFKMESLVFISLRF